MKISKDNLYSFSIKSNVSTEKLIESISLNDCEKSKHGP